jgi:dCMP deaminase
MLDLPHGSGYDYCIAVHAEENCIINAARTGSSVLGGVLYIYGIDAKSNKIIKGMPCDRCKRAIINAGITRVVMMDEDENIEYIDVREWIKLDTEKYVEMVMKVKKELEEKGSY